MKYQIPKISMLKNENCEHFDLFTRYFNSADYKSKTSKYIFPIGYDNEKDKFYIGDMEKEDIIYMSGMFYHMDDQVNVFVSSLLFRVAPEDLNMYINTSVDLGWCNLLPHVQSKIEWSSTTADHFICMLEKLFEKLKERKTMFFKSKVTNINDYNLKNNKALPHIMFFMERLRFRCEVADNKKEYIAKLLYELSDNHISDYGLHLIVSFSDGEPKDIQIADTLKVLEQCATLKIKYEDEGAIDYLVSFQKNDVKITDLKSIGIGSVNMESIFNYFKEKHNIQNNNDLNKILHKLSKGSLTIIGGRPQTGKTTFVRRLFDDARKRGEKGLFFDGKCANDFTDIETICKEKISQGGLDFIIVDYLDADDTKTAQQLKQLAERLNIIVIAASQLHRFDETKRLPNYDDLSPETGNAANIIILLDSIYSATVYKEYIGKIGTFPIIMQDESEETKMDIYEFINSKDIREHCRKLNHKFNTLESAYLVYQSRKTIAEKHAAYREIIDTMPDMEFKRRNFIDVDYDSLHQFLREYIDAEKKVIEMFKSEDRAVYRWAALPEFTEENCDMFEDWKSCLDSCEECCEECLVANNVTEYRIAKYWIKKSKDDDEERLIVAYFNSDKEMIRIFGYTMDDADRDIQKTFDTIWIEVPTPFKRGDIVFEPGGFAEGYPPIACPFVLYSLCTWDNEERLIKKRKFADNSDMTADGYFYEDDAVNLYGECMHNYLNLEYYPGLELEYFSSRLAGRERALTALSSFFKGKIDEALLINSFIIIDREEDVKRRRQYLNYTDEMLRISGLE